MLAGEVILSIMCPGRLSNKVVLNICFAEKQSPGKSCDSGSIPDSDGVPRCRWHLIMKLLFLKYQVPVTVYYLLSLERESVFFIFRKEHLMFATKSEHFVQLPCL